MKVKVPTIGLELEGIVHRTCEHFGAMHGSTYKVVEHVKDKLGSYVSFEGGASNSGAMLFEVKTNPHGHIAHAVSEMTGLVRDMHNAMSDYHRSATAVRVAKQAEEKAYLQGLDEEERAEYFAYGGLRMGNEDGQRLYFAGNAPHTGEGHSAFNSKDFGNTHNTAAGLHLHAGVPFHQQEEVAKKLEPYAPLFVALTASSPFDHNGKPGYASYRMLERNMPHKGGSESDPQYFRYGEKMTLQGKYNRSETLECLVMDSVSDPEVLACVSSIYQALVCKAMHTDKMDCTLKSAVYKDEDYTSNMSKVCIEGLSAELTHEDGRMQSAEEAIEDMLYELDPYLQAIGTGAQAHHARTIMREGTSAERQVQVYKESLRAYELDGRKQADMDTYAMQVGQVPFDQLPQDKQDAYCQSPSYDPDGVSPDEHFRRSAVMQDVEKSLIRESLAMARVGRDKAPKEEAYAMNHDGDKAHDIKTLSGVEEKLQEAGHVLEVEVDVEVTQAPKRDSKAILSLA